MGRSDDMARAFRGELGLDNRVAYGEQAMAPANDRPPTKGLVLEDVDLLLQRRERESFGLGHAQGFNEALEMAQRQHAVELGQYVGSALSLVESDVLSTIVLAAVKARDSRATKGELVQAVIDAVKREGAALSDIAHRARTGELFS